MRWITFVNSMRLWGKKEKALGEFCTWGIFEALLRFITCLCVCVFELKHCVCACLPAWLHVDTAYIACLKQ